MWSVYSCLFQVSVQLLVTSQLVSQDTDTEVTLRKVSDRPVQTTPAKKMCVGLPTQSHTGDCSVVFHGVHTASV